MYAKDLLKKLIAVTLVVIVLLIVAVFVSKVPDAYSRAVDFDYSVKRLQSVNTEPELLGTNTDTVVPRDASVNAELFDECPYALLVGESDNKIYVAKNAHRRIYPASMTKLMTAIIVCERIESGMIDLDDVVTIDRYYDLTDEGVLPFLMTYGDKITVKDLLYCLLVESNNYFAMVLADYVAGDQESFCALMNRKARDIGATNTHYMNPHGLDDPEHYTSPYDIYLIVKEAESHELIRKIDEFESYGYTYEDADGNKIEMEAVATNYFMNGTVKLPAGVTIGSWKTGTTEGAGYCLVMYFEKDKKKYVAVTASLENKDELYGAMARMIGMTE